MKLLPFGDLPVYTARRFVPDQIDLGDWPQVEPLYDQLEARAADCASVAELERWILDGGELAAALDEECTKRHIAMTCHTDSPEAEAAYLHFVEHVEPRIKPRRFRLNELYLAHPLRAKLPRPRYTIFDRDLEARARLYRPENVALETEESKLSQQYQKIVRLAHRAVPRRGKDAHASRSAAWRNLTGRCARRRGN